MADELRIGEGIVVAVDRRGGADERNPYGCWRFLEGYRRAAPAELIGHQAEGRGRVGQETIERIAVVVGRLVQVDPMRRLPQERVTAGRADRYGVPRLEKLGRPERVLGQIWNCGKRPICLCPFGWRRMAIGQGWRVVSGS